MSHAIDHGVSLPPEVQISEKLIAMNLEKLPRYPLAQLPTPIQSLPALTCA